MGLIELIVYVALTAVAVTVTATIVVSAHRAEADTRQRDHATGTAQVVAVSIQNSIRNAACAPAALEAGTCTKGFAVDGDLLRARVAVAGGWECRAWSIAAIGGRDRLVYTRSANLISAGSDRRTWTQLAVDVNGNLDASGTAFLDAGGVLVLGITVGTGGGTSSVATRTIALAKQDPSDTGGPSTCWD